MSSWFDFGSSLFGMAGGESALNEANQRFSDNVQLRFAGHFNQPSANQDDFFGVNRELTQRTMELGDYRGERDRAFGVPDPFNVKRANYDDVEETMGFGVADRMRRTDDAFEQQQFNDWIDNPGIDYQPEPEPYNANYNSFSMFDEFVKSRM